MPLSDERVAALLTEARKWEVDLDADTLRALTQAIERFTPCECGLSWWNGPKGLQGEGSGHSRYKQRPWNPAMLDSEVYPDDARFCMFCGRRLEVPHA